MIYIDRQSASIPAIFDSKGVNTKETKAVILHYKTYPSQPFKGYKVYNDPLVKSAIIALFQKKCAYCESRIMASQPGDVEHFRPKNEVLLANGKKLAPGYYWLAANWNNLLLSCIDCNRRRMHAIADSPKKVLLGKLNQFPLVAESARWKNARRNGLQKEEGQRLLIDPCLDRPEKFFEYTEAGLIIPKKGLNNFERQKAEMSIQVYALQRMDLVMARKEHYLDFIKAALTDIENINTIKDRSNNQLKKKMIDQKINTLLEKAGTDQQYSALTKFFLRKYFKIHLPGPAKK